MTRMAAIDAGDEGERSSRRPSRVYGQILPDGASMSAHATVEPFRQIRRSARFRPHRGDGRGDLPGQRRLPGFLRGPMQLLAAP